MTWLTPRAISAIALGLVLALLVLYALVEPRSFGFDYLYYKNLGVRWLETGTYYWPHQLAGPYQFTHMLDNLYPPSALLLFVPAVFAPALLWWVVPAAVVGYALWTWRPGAWATAIMLVLMCWPKSYVSWIYGSTDIWMMAGVAGGLLWGWPAVLIFLKPTLAPLALVGAGRRSWWVAVVALVIVSLAAMPMWLDYLTAMRNLVLSPLAAIQGVPLLLIPIVGWWASYLRTHDAVARRRVRTADVTRTATSSWIRTRLGADWRT
jgi:hypothetical protein